MTLFNTWSRRRFLASSGALLASSVAHRPAFPQAVSAARAKEAASVMPPPGVITGGIEPLLETNTARPLRYSPDHGDFLIRNGTELFNRPLYGPKIDFRVDAGDLPEFSLYLPGHGGNLKLGIASDAGSKWASYADTVIARYRPGRMIYEIQDRLLEQGSLLIELLTSGSGSGLLLRAEGRNMPLSARLTWAFGGVSGRKGRRNGDIGCELEPVSIFFQLRPEECSGNQYSIPDPALSLSAARLHSRACDLMLTFPTGAQLGVTEFDDWNKPPAIELAYSGAASPQLPILTGSIHIDNSPLYFAIQRVAPSEKDLDTNPVIAFQHRSGEVAAIASKLKITTPDQHIDACAPALGIAADAIWDSAQGCVMHGGVAWRVPLAGWRGPYCLDSLGDHDRMRLHLRHWLKRQNLSSIDTPDPAQGPADAQTHLARKEAMLHSNGDISYSHYDMNMVFFDALLRHLRWTGDLEFAREVWPAFKRHLAWEHRLFRRLYTGPDGSQLPLYEAYAVIWASDNLQYNGGGAAHSSAYNLYAFRTAAQLARLLDEDPAPFEAEAELIQRAMEQHLWLPHQGAFAESKDILDPKTVYNNPALWTVYHTIDSEASTPRQAWQMIADRLSVLRRVPVHGDQVPAGPWYMLSCSNWLPYIWSLNLLALVENVHMALAMWQAGRADDAYALLKGNLLDSMFQGLTPGNFHMTSQLDVHRQEAQRDSGDPIGITARALIEGLFGIQPDLLRNQIRIHPGFPSEWKHASLNHRDFDLSWRREGQRDVYEFTSRLPKAVPVTLALAARTTSLPRVLSNGAAVPCSFDASAVGAPAVTIDLAASRSYKVELQWHGNPPAQQPSHRTYKPGEQLHLPAGISRASIDDPQQCLSSGHVSAPGNHVVFANMHEGDCAWSLPITFEVVPDKAHLAPVPPLRKGRAAEPIDLSSLLQHRITDIFARKYDAPRSPYCSLALPRQLVGGWANMDFAATVDDRGLREAGGVLNTPLGVPFRTPTGQSPNCLFLSHWNEDKSSASIALSGRAEGIYLLMAGTTYPQCSRMEHAQVRVNYSDATSALLSLRNPETWWPIDEDYLLDDYLFVNDAPPPPRVNLIDGQTRILSLEEFKGKGRPVPGGAATILHLPLDPEKQLSSLEIEVELYGIVVALLAATLVRSS